MSEVITPCPSAFVSEIICWQCVLPMLIVYEADMIFGKNYWIYGYYDTNLINATQDGLRLISGKLQVVLKIA